MANWIIDRTINLDDFKTRTVLNELLITPRKSDSELEVILHQKGVLKNEGDGALRRRWYTYLRNYGLLLGDDVTEMGKLYASSQLSLQELSLLQLIKKQIKLANNVFIFPLKVLVGVLSNLAANNLEEAYITREEFTNFIVNISSDSDTDITRLANTINGARNNGLILTNVDGQHDDIWFNSLSQTKLFDYFGRSLYVANFEVLKLINNYYINKLSLPITYGNYSFGLIDNIVLPTKNGLSFDLKYAQNDKYAALVLFDFFFSNISLRKIEEKYYGNKKQYVGVKNLLSKLKIDLTNHGLYTDYKNYPNIILLRLIGSGDAELMEVARIMQSITVEEQNEIQEEISHYDTCERLKTGTNIILYGVPGAGKSWTIKNEYCDDDSRMERLVFHPDYTYSDFVGQILPKPDGNGGINYEFTPGPFTTLVKKAYINPMQEFFLVIEEVNRGNAPAIFGDIFQLLDRTSDGGSAYKITNADIARIVYGDENHKLSIPSNMSILCTMNTSDQNVFTLDTAFQRRWSMRLIKNKFTDDPKEIAFAKTPILDTSVTWETFFTKINNIILSKNIRMTSSEDKRLGTHFVSVEDLKYVDISNVIDKKELLIVERQNKKFAEKVLKYLWDDAFKFNKDEIFDLSKVNSLEKVIDEFTSAKGDARFKAIFKDNISSTLLPKPQTGE